VVLARRPVWVANGEGDEVSTVLIRLKARPPFFIVAVLVRPAAPQTLSRGSVDGQVGIGGQGGLDMEYELLARNIGAGVNCAGMLVPLA
jgi:hypothetical protein